VVVDLLGKGEGDWLLAEFCEASALDELSEDFLFFRRKLGCVGVSRERRPSRRSIFRRKLDM
jgi:hypothetical protein